jgi:hypothetical protein
MTVAAQEALTDVHWDPAAVHVDCKPQAAVTLSGSLVVSVCHDTAAALVVSRLGVPVGPGCSPAGLAMR